MAINRSDARPLSAQIADDLRTRIVGGEFKVGQKLSSLRTLATEYGVAELTVHAAVKELQHQGVLASTSGRGTFVQKVPDQGEAGRAAVMAREADLVALREEVKGLRERVEELEARVVSHDR